MKNVKLIIGIGVICLVLNLYLVFAAVSFQVTSFSCSPTESVINSVFSCTAQIKNNGDASGAVSVATLYPDSNNWLENSNYPQSSGTSVSPGQSTEVTFSGLRAVKSGSNGFSKIMLDSVTDNYVSDQNKKVNIINDAVTVSNSVSSAAMGSSFDVTSEVTAGGNVDVQLNFVVNSGGCSIGSQASQKTITGMTDGSKQSRSWTVNQGTSGSCSYTISAIATGVGGIASKTDSTPGTVTCTNCPVTSTTPGSTGGSSGGSGAGGGAGAKTYIIGELSGNQMVELLTNEKISFNISGKEHIVTLKNLTDTEITITVESDKQTFMISAGNEINVDLNKDNLADVNIKLKSINVITKKVTLILSKITGEVAPTKSLEEGGTGGGEISSEETGKGSNLTGYIIIGLIIVFIIIAIIAIYYIIKRRRYH